MKHGHDTKGLQEAMIAFEPIKHYQRLDNWIKGAICQHSKYLMFQAYFLGKKGFSLKYPNNQCPTKQQWQQGFVKNPNAMDLTCYVLVEFSAQRELGGYDFDALHIVLEASASDTL